MLNMSYNMNESIAKNVIEGTLKRKGLRLKTEYLEMVVNQIKDLKGTAKRDKVLELLKQNPEIAKPLIKPVPGGYIMD